MARKYEIKGYTDSINECDCCGKENLKGTYIMVSEYEEIKHFGSSCAIKANPFLKEEIISKDKQLKKILKVDGVLILIQYRKAGGKFIQSSINEPAIPQDKTLWEFLWDKNFQSNIEHAKKIGLII